MEQDVVKVGLLCLPDNQLEIFSAMTRKPGYRPEVVIDFNPNAYSYKMAEILQIPTAAQLDILKRFPCQIIVIPEGRPDLKVDVTRFMGSNPVRILTVAEISAELGIEPTAGKTDEPYASGDWRVPLRLKKAEIQETPGAPEPAPSRTLNKTPKSGHEPEPDPAPGHASILDRLASGNEEADAGDEPAAGDALRIEAVADWTPAPARAAAGDASPPETADASSAGDMTSELSAMAETLNLAFDKHQLLRRILQIAVNAAGGDSGSIMLLDETGDYLRIAVADGLSDDVVKQTRQRIGDGVAGNVLLEGRSRILTETLKDPRYKSGRERSMIKAAVSVPIKAGTRTIGVLNVSSNTDIAAFRQETISLLERFGVEVAGIILKAVELADSGKPFEEQIASCVNALMGLEEPLPVRLERVADKLTSLSNAWGCRIYLYDGTGRRLEPVAGSGQSTRATTPMLADRGLAGWVLANGKAEAFVSVYAETEKRAFFCFPMESRTPVGLVEIDGARVDESNRAEIFFAMESAIGTLATLIDKDRSTGLLARRTDQILRLSDLAAEMMSDLDADELGTLAVRSAAEIFDADLAVLRLKTDEAPILSRPEFGTTDDGDGAVMRFDAELSAAATQQDRTLTPATMDAPLQDTMAGEESIRWAVALPLSVTGKCFGVLSLYGLTPGTRVPHGDELAVLDKFSGYLARSLSRQRHDQADRAVQGFMQWPAFEEKIAEEVRRAERYGRSFSITTMDLDGFEKLRAVHDEAWTDAVRFALADFVQHHVREVDITAWVHGARVAVMSPEVVADPGALARRLQQEWGLLAPTLKINELAGLSLIVDDVSFPDDLRTWEECVDWIRGPAAGSTDERRRAG